MSHSYKVPQVREVVSQSAPKAQPVAADTRRAYSQRDLVAASLIARPQQSGAQPKYS